jgi:predicted transcriptional regulator
MTRFPKINFSLISFGALTAGLTTGTLLTVKSPEFFGVSMAFGAGVVGGLSAAKVRMLENNERKSNTERVTSTFSALYEVNNGIVEPTQLAYLANIQPQQAYNFLEGLAENTGGQKVQTKANNGIIFAFPHASNALEELSKNAQNWAKAQTEGLVFELEKHKQAIQMMQSQNASLMATISNSQKSSTDNDPWNKELT